MNKSFLALLAVALLAAVGGYFAAMQFAPQSASPEPASGIVGQLRPNFRHTDLGGRELQAGDFDGQVLLVNFWASWCKPCVEEMPMLSELQLRHRDEGLRVIGIALDDPERAAAFARAMDLAYPVLVGGVDTVVTGRRFGNASGMLPYSVLVGRDGVMRWSRLGALEAGPLAVEVEKALGSVNRQ